MNLSDFRDIHKGGRVIVCGLGESIKTLTNPAEHVTIGVNDIGRHFDPDYLVCINTAESFTYHRWQYIFGSAAKYLFTQLDFDFNRAGLYRAEVVQFKLSKKRDIDLLSDESLPCTSNSPYVALALAAYMGAARVGLIGVDFIDHPNLTNAKRVDREYARLGEALRHRGVEVFNLSAISKLEAFPKISIEEFAR